MLAHQTAQIEKILLELTKQATKTEKVYKIIEAIAALLSENLKN
jgi:hypothetical protein